MMQVDTLALLRDLNIPYKETGKNVSSGWVGVNCPFCTDPSYHMGINVENATFSCWRCRERGFIVRFVEEILNIDNKAAYGYCLQFSDRQEGFSLNPQSPTESKPNIDAITLPGESPGPNSQSFRYLESRGLNAGFVSEYFELQETDYSDPEFKYRIIIPVYIKRKLVTFLGRDYTDKANLRYKNLSKEKSIIPVKKTILNYDKIQKSCFITEGPFDAFALGEDATCLFGSEYTKEQIELLYSKGLERVVVIYDPEAFQIGEQLANELAGFVPDVKEVQLDPGQDPGSLPRKEVFQIKRLLS